LSVGLDPVEAAGLCGRAARTIAESLRSEKDANARSSLAEALAALSIRLDPAGAAAIARTVAESLRAEKDRDAYKQLAKALTALSVGLDPADAAAIARTVAESIRAEKAASARSQLAEALAALLVRLDPVEAAGLCGRAARTVAESIQAEKDAYARSSLAEALAALSIGLDPVEAAGLCGRAARTIAESLQAEKNVYARLSLAEALAALSVRLDPADAAAIARTVAESLRAEKDAYARSNLVKALAALSVRLDPAGAAAISRIVAESLRAEKSASARSQLAEALVALSVRLAPAEIEVIRNRVASLIIEPMILMTNKDKGVQLRSIYALVDLSAQADLPKLAQFTASFLCSRSSMTDERANLSVSDSLERLLGSNSASIVKARILQLAATSLQFGASGTIAMTIREAIEPPPCRLNSQELVELLKMPTCFGATRRVVLDQLGNIHGRRFANHREFVRFAREKGLKLDFTSPPRRPDLKAPLARLLDERPASP
jgi:hypothetical protein